MPQKDEPLQAQWHHLEGEEGCHQTGMKDIGCLTINEDKSNTVHIGKLKDGKRPLPRVLLIDVQTLRDNAEKYELFAEQARE